MLSKPKRKETTGLATQEISVHEPPQSPWLAMVDVGRHKAEERGGHTRTFCADIIRLNDHYSEIYGSDVCLGGSLKSRVQSATKLWLGSYQRVGVDRK